MAISGVALLAICTLLGAFLGEMLGAVLGVKANVGGVGFAMILLIGLRICLSKRKAFYVGVRLGVAFWGALYIPIVVAMAADQNVVAAVKSGPMVVVAAGGALVVCLSAVALISRFSGPVETMDQIEARQAAETSAFAVGLPSSVR